MHLEANTKIHGTRYYHVMYVIYQLRESLESIIHQFEFFTLLLSTYPKPGILLLNAKLLHTTLILLAAMAKLAQTGSNLT